MAGGAVGGVNEQPAVWDSVYFSKDHRIVENIAATPFEQGATKTQLSRFGAEWSRVELRGQGQGQEASADGSTVATEEVSPGPRYAHAMAAAEEEGAAYLFGGAVCSHTTTRFRSNLRLEPRETRLFHRWW